MSEMPEPEKRSSGARSAESQAFGLVFDAINAIAVKVDLELGLAADLLKAIAGWGEHRTAAAAAAERKRIATDLRGHASNADCQVGPSAKAERDHQFFVVGLWRAIDLIENGDVPAVAKPATEEP